MNGTAIAPHMLSSDIIGLSVGMGITVALAITSIACASVYRRKTPCPYCKTLLDHTTVQEHLSQCPKHLEFWKLRGTDPEGSVMYVQTRL